MYVYIKRANPKVSERLSENKAVAKMRSEESKIRIQTSQIFLKIHKDQGTPKIVFTI